MPPAVDAGMAADPADEGRDEWREVWSGGAVVFHEAALSDADSLFHYAASETDPQMGIAIYARIAAIAHGRGVRYIRFSDEPPAGDRPGDLVRSAGDLDPDGTRASGVLHVEFLTADPPGGPGRDGSGFVSATAMWAAILR